MNAQDMHDIRLSDAVEAAACRDIYSVGPAGLRLRVEEIAGATLMMAPSIPATYFNRVIGLGDTQEAREQDVDALIAVYRDAGVKDFWVHLTPSAQPAALPAWLSARGLNPPPRRSWAKFLRGPEAPPAARTDMNIRLATQEDAAAVAHIVAIGFEMPPALGPWFSALIGRKNWQVFVACDGDKPVASGAVFIDGENAWLGVGAALPEYRRRGAQSALLAARIQAAADAGCKHLVTETGEPVDEEHNPPLANIRRCGFRQVCSRVNYAPG